LVIDRETWRAAVCGVAKSQTQLNDSTELNCRFGEGCTVQSLKVSYLPPQGILSTTKIRPWWYLGRGGGLPLWRWWEAPKADILPRLCTVERGKKNQPTHRKRECCCVAQNMKYPLYHVVKKTSEIIGFLIKNILVIWVFHAAAAKSLQSCPTLCNPIDGSPPGSPISGILQSWTLEWVAISFSSAWKWSCSVVSDSVRPHRRQPTRLLRPWDFPGKSTGVGECSIIYEYFALFLTFHCGKYLVQMLMWPHATALWRNYGIIWLRFGVRHDYLCHLGSFMFSFWTWVFWAIKWKLCLLGPPEKSVW